MKKICAVLFGLVLFPSFAFPAGSNFSLKIGGGMGCVFGGEINDFLRDQTVYMRLVNSEVSDDLGQVHLGPGFSLEAVYSFSPAFSLGLSAGYGGARNKGSMHREYPGASGPIFVDETYEPRICYLPVLLSAYYTLALNSKWSVILGAGAGLHWLGFEFERSVQDERASGINFSTNAFSASRATLGAQAGAALEMSINPFLSVFISAGLRLASASGFVGKDDEEWGGTDGSGSQTEQDQVFWIYTYRFEGTEYTMFHISDERYAEGPIIYNVHEGKVDISGVALTIGARIKL